MGASLIFKGRTLLRSDRRLAVIRIGLKDEAIKASILSLPISAAPDVNHRAGPGFSGSASR